MKIKNAILSVVFLNIIAVTSLVLVTKNLFLIPIVLLNLFLGIRTAWSRKTLIVLFYIGLISTSAGLIYKLYVTEEFRTSCFNAGAFSLAAIYLIYSLFILASQSVKSHYQKVIPRDPYDPEGWICPKCSSKMVFAVTCWNCGFKQEDLLKPSDPEIVESKNQKKTEENKIDSYLKKKGGESPHA